MLQLIYELRKNCCGTGGRVDGEIEGSTRGPRGPKKKESSNSQPERLFLENKEILGGSSDEYVETLFNESEHCRLYLFSESRKCKPAYGVPLSPAGLGRENGFWKFDRFHQQV